MSQLKPFLFLFLLLLCASLLESRFLSSLPIIPNICHQPPPRSTGICTVEFEGYYYDSATLDCQMYTIGGCRLTPGQSFGSLQNCVETCVHGLRRNQDLYVNE
ncbi:mambaquaretin-6 [Drosophila tropicalis]|uniref:mambaquaretin-6 n=1 Tax=Drosophila tropicalis TaxID=46794 RepID=UPI0035ABCFD0